MKRAVIWVTGALVLSCSEVAREPAAEPPVLRAWAPLVGSERPTVKRSAGEDCSTTGRDGCGEGVCLHIEPHANRGYVCSKKCGVDDDCPASWGCRPMVPGDVVSHCVPPKGWAAGVTAARQVRVSARPSEPPVIPPLPIDGGVR